MSKVKFVTPAGIAQYPWLQPGRPDTAFDAAGKWKVNLLLTPDESKALMDIVTSAKNDNFAPKDVVRVPFKKDEETGQLVFTISSKYQPKYIDAKGNPIPEAQVPLMYSGSTIRVSGMCEAYSGTSKGVSLRMNAVQVINPVSGSGDGAAGDFEPVEGFTAGSAETSEASDFDF
jgi:hypothetical protein